MRNAFFTLSHIASQFPAVVMLSERASSVIQGAYGKISPQMDAFLVSLLGSLVCRGAASAANSALQFLQQLVLSRSNKSSESAAPTPAETRQAAIKTLAYIARNFQSEEIQSLLITVLLDCFIDLGARALSLLEERTIDASWSLCSDEPSRRAHAAGNCTAHLCRALCLAAHRFRLRRRSWPTFKRC